MPQGAINSPFISAYISIEKHWIGKIVKPEWMRMGIGPIYSWEKKISGRGRDSLKALTDSERWL
jgi:hypothetical protein